MGFIDMKKGLPSGAKLSSAPPNKAARADLRALIQEKVHEYTLDQYTAYIQDPDNDPDKAPEVIEEYDAVVQLALIAVDSRTERKDKIKCHAEVAQYTRPKLKSIEVSESEGTLEAKREMANDIFSMLDKLGRRRIAEGEEA